VSSRRHEQAEREMIVREVMDGAKGWALWIGGFLLVAWPWYLFKDHNHASRGRCIRSHCWFDRGSAPDSSWSR